MATCVITRQWSDGLWIRPPPEIVSATELHAHQRVRGSARVGQVRINPAKEAVLSLEQRLAQQSQGHLLPFRSPNNKGQSQKPEEILRLVIKMNAKFNSSLEPLIAGSSCCVAWSTSETNGRWFVWRGI